jgi:hypothetical protein
MIIVVYVAGVLVATLITLVCLWLALKIVGGSAPLLTLLVLAFVTSLLGMVPFVGLILSILVLAYLLYQKAGAPTPLSAVLAAGITRLLAAFTVVGLRLWLMTRGA